MYLFILCMVMVSPKVMTLFYKRKFVEDRYFETCSTTESATRRGRERLRKGGRTFLHVEVIGRSKPWGMCGATVYVT
ncbi:hypothetical protein V8E53_007050 [Lactarius tabidus]